MMTAIEETIGAPSCVVTVEEEKSNTKEPLRAPEAPAEISCFSSAISSIFLLLSGMWVWVIAIPAAIWAGLRKICRRKKSVRGKLCVITGTGRGMGRLLALRMAKRGALIICTDLNETNNNRTVEEIRKEGGKAFGYKLNVANRDNVMEVFKKIQDEHGPVDILVNNAGLVSSIRVEDWTEADVAATYNVNCFGMYWTISACLPTMRRRNEGQIVTLSSMSAITSIQYLSVYAGTKAAVAAMSDSLRFELEMNPDNKIKVTTVFPYFVNTSADYSTYFGTRTPPLSENDATNGILNAILYEEDNVSIPGYMYAGSLFMKMLPRTVAKQSLSITGTFRSAADDNQRKTYSNYTIVDEIAKDRGYQT